MSLYRLEGFCRHLVLTIIEENVNYFAFLKLLYLQVSKNVFIFAHSCFYFCPSEEELGTYTYLLIVIETVHYI